MKHFTLHQQCEFHRTRSLSLVSNLWEVCVIYVTANTQCATDLCLCAGFCITARVCLLLVTLEPFVLFSDPDPSHLSSQISLTHTHTFAYTIAMTPFLELKLNRSCQPSKTCQHSKVLFSLLWVYIWLKRSTVCFKMNCRNLTPCYHIKWLLKWLFFKMKSGLLVSYGTRTDLAKKQGCYYFI